MEGPRLMDGHPHMGILPRMGIHPHMGNHRPIHVHNLQTHQAGVHHMDTSHPINIHIGAETNTTLFSKLM